MNNTIQFRDPPQPANSTTPDTFVVLFPDGAEVPLKELDPEVDIDFDGSEIWSSDHIYLAYPPHTENGDPVTWYDVVVDDTEQDVLEVLYNMVQPT